MSVSPAVIKETQSRLGKFIKKPPLTDKLLTKPPFRFLHDVFSIAMKETGALKGLFEDSELDSNNVKEKEAKVEYLTKIIDCLSIATDATLQVKPGKIVSGQEAEKTNQLLLALATVIEKKIDTSDAVKRVKSGEKPAKSAKKSSKPKEEVKGNRRSADKREDKENRENNRRSSISKKPVSKQNSKESPRKAKPRSPSPPKEEDPPEGGNAGALEEEEEGDLPSLAPQPSEEPTAIVNQNGSLDSPGTNEPTSRPQTTRDKRQRSSDKQNRSADKRQRSSDRRQRSAEKKSPEPELQDPEVLGAQADEEPSDRPTTAANRPTTASNRPTTAVRPKTGRLRSARPPSARPAAPRIRERTAVNAEEQPRPATAKVANLILDTEVDDQDAEEFLIEEAPRDIINNMEEGVAVEEGGEEHGGLVQQILETQKELQHGNKIQKGVEIEREEGVGEAGRARDREGTMKEVEKLRGSIQTLTRSANPLGKLMDFLQEDVDSMQRELETWKTDNNQLQLQLRHEESLTQDTLQPLGEHLTELTAAVQEQLDKISLVKSNILKNEEKISKMISSIGVSNR